MNQDDKHIVVKGTKLTVEYGVLDDASMPSKDFLNDLKEEDRAYFLARMNLLAQVGVLGVQNDRVFKQERDFWSFKKQKCKGGPKDRKMVRIVAFRKSDRLILTHGFWKPPKSEWQESEFTRAEKIRDEILAREKRQGK